MSKLCAKCSKAVYPLEELKCLDKIWHKGCFKCTVCGMTLNMKNYKGYNKSPYCNAHYPRTVPTAVADTPEMERLRQASKLQSQITYHNDFKKSMGQYTQIADDQEMNRLRKNQQTFSTAKYHEEFEKNIKGSKIQIADDPETQRMKQLSSMSEVEYRGLREKFNEMEAKRYLGGDDQKAPPRGDSSGDNNYPPQQPQQQSYPPQQQQPQHSTNKSFSDRSSCHSTSYTGQGKVEHHNGNRKVGSISDYDPSITKQSRQWQETHPYNPLPSQPQAKQAVASSQGMVCMAIYTYAAQDEDEVSFKEGDLIMMCEPIDEGWMYGTVKNSGVRGMLPSNYVEKM